MNHQQFIDKRLGKRYAESLALGYQCVWALKLYCNERWRWQLPSFWWSAYTWRLNTKNTFDLTKYLRVANAPQLYPSQWDIVIFWPTGSNPYWHIWICHSADLDSIDLISQNWATGNWKWIGGDAIVHRNYTYKWVCGRYHYKQQETPVITPQEIDASTIWELLIADKIRNGELWEGISERLILLLEKLYAKSKNQ